MGRVQGGGERRGRDRRGRVVVGKEREERMRGGEIRVVREGKRSGEKGK